MSWMRRFGRNRASNTGDAARVRREVGEMLDPYHERASIDDGEGQLIVAPGQVLANLRERMERVDLDPGSSWAPEELMSQTEMAFLFVTLRQGPMVIGQTAWFARQVLSRWPLQMVEHPISDEARLDMFVEGVHLEQRLDEAGRRVVNRALANPVEIDAHPELDGLAAEDLMGVWLAVVFWFGVKSSRLHAVT